MAGTVSGGYRERIRGRIHSKWGRLVASPSRSLSWISPRSSVSWTDQTNKACATCRLDCLGRIKTLLDISAGESSEETTGEGEQREKENCQDGYWEQLRTKYRQRDRGEMDRSGQKKMAGRPTRVCNGGRKSVCPSARSSCSFHDQFESGEPGMRYLQSMVLEPKPREWFIGIVCTNRGQLGSSLSVLYRLWYRAKCSWIGDYWTETYTGWRQGVTDWLRGCGAECVLTDPCVIRVWFWDAKHGWRTVYSGWLVGDQASAETQSDVCGRCTFQDITVMSLELKEFTTYNELMSLGTVEFLRHNRDLIMGTRKVCHFGTVNQEGLGV
ncbi:hypothetical protein F2Q70_00001197 [Brassica cretica]|uniref:Uncharacterized protein n=1 Tax=Brassica cretica TaxID=69181 RepID=A0A8S9IZD5_BRACR|nr:hypothetical protein F2Q70_00001197 [Brassica cretica]